MINYKDSELEVSMGFSREWDARKAGREVAETAINKLKNPPSLFLLFSTIHYRDHGGFQELLDGIWDVLPKGTPLIGGTVAGFINNYGCYARGATALAISYPNIDVILGYGKHTKRNPKLAAKKCANMISQGLNNSIYKNKLLINVISGAAVAKLPYVGRLNIIRSKFFAWVATNIGTKLFPLIEYGWGKSEDVIDQLSKSLPDYYIIGGSSVDSGEYLHNYQFIEKKVVTNSIVAIGCSVDLPIFLKSELSLHETEKKFEITGKTTDRRIIKKLNNKPAKEQILNAFGIIEEQFRNLDSFYYDLSNYFPVTFEENKKYTSGIAGFFGNNVFLGHKCRGKTLRLLSLNGRELLDAIDVIFHGSDEDNFPFVFFSSSSIFLNTLGAKTYFLKRKIDDYIKNIPYLMIFTLTENVGLPEEPAVARVYSFNALAFENEPR